MRINWYIAKVSKGNVPRRDGGQMTNVPPKAVIDSSLLFGLEEAILEPEKVFLTQLMMSGQENKLAQATQILLEIERAVRKGQMNANIPALVSPARIFFGKVRTDNEKEKRALQMAISPKCCTKLLPMTTVTMIPYHPCSMGISILPTSRTIILTLKR